MPGMRTSVIAFLIGTSLAAAGCGSNSTADSNDATPPSTKTDAGTNSGGSAGPSSGGSAGTNSGGSGGNPTSPPGTGGSGGATNADSGTPPVGAADALPPPADGLTAPADAFTGPPAAPEKFAALWKYDSGTARLDCPGQAPLMENLKGATLTFSIGSGVAPLILASTDCNLRFDIKGASAVVQPGQACMNPVAGIPATSEATVFTFSLVGDEAIQLATWKVTFKDAPDKPCTLSNEGRLTTRMP